MEKDHGIWFVDGFRSKLIQQTTEVDVIADEMLSNNMIHPEAYSKICAAKTSQEKMRALFDAMRSGGDKAKAELYRLLKENHPLLITELEKCHKQGQVEKDEDTLHPRESSVDTQPDRANVYDMKRIPRGYCVIINNRFFPQRAEHKQERRGTEKDACKLKETFEWLGFTVELCENKSADEIRSIMKQYGKKYHDDKDCFVACVLSHGRQKEVLGIDEKFVTVDDILEPFEGNNCPTLVCKPKVFFIQACQGNNMQPFVEHQTDEPEDESLEEDALARVPVQADFLIGMSTVQHSQSIRTVMNGSWYIQSLCQKLKENCPKGVDILTILTYVNLDVSRSDGVIKKQGKIIQAKQIPELRSTLTKTLVFSVPK